jgi:hypothetical protein
MYGSLIKTKKGKKKGKKKWGKGKYRKGKRRGKKRNGKNRKRGGAQKGFNNWLQLWDDNPLRVVKNPESHDQMFYPLGNGVETVRMYKIK